MTTSALTTNLDQASTRPHALRMLLVGLAVVVLLAVAFTVGHLTAGSHQGPVSGPTHVQAHAGVADEAGSFCPAGRLPGPC
jgi:hypothetical protein